MPVSFPTLTTYPTSSTSSTTHFPVHNPATGTLLTTIAAGDIHTTTAAIEAAEKAYQSDWRWRSPLERATFLLKIADELEKHSEELAEILCLENGKPYQDALNFDVKFASAIFRYFGGLIGKLPGEMYEAGGVYVQVHKEPFGVTAGILPFNWPPIHTGGKIAPAIAMGNTIIIKPGEQAPLTSIRMIEIMQTILPPNVVQFVLGHGPEVPQLLASHPLIKKISLTGSTAAGAAAARTAASHVIPATLELGGKNAIVVFEDADLERAVLDALEGAFFNKGEACTAGSRLLVHSSIHDKFVERLAAMVSKLVVGDGMDDKTHVGPCVSKAQQEKVLKYIEIGKDEGAEIVVQAKLPKDEKCKEGYFVPPTLFKAVTKGMRILMEEMFGPVVTVTKFENEKEAIEIVNDTPYGLTCGIYSRDSEKCLRVARHVDAGVIFINNYNRAAIGTPFGGMKESGYGREHCIETLNEWSTPKQIRIPNGLSSIPSWRAIADVTKN
ncbi:related to aldehyde dehydrogenase [Phialocephala subalpina]|uniref:aldehyde dehydrogenase (NAD(+)) n=1 Tax=Phialocephala subalpina TaxID=576137 RepID=A0A1L7WWU4_9HELO|nr:related to aldehyde dehydrogenase [Phialocephala subalpina]